MRQMYEPYQFQFSILIIKVILDIITSQPTDLINSKIKFRLF